MKLAIIQDRPVYKFNGAYYFANFSDIIKYGALCDEFVYCCSVINASEIDVQKLKLCNFPKVRIMEVTKSPLKEMFRVSSANKQVVNKAMEDTDLIIIKTPSITLGKWAQKHAELIGKPYILEVIACAWDCYWYHSLKGKVMALYSFFNCKSMVAKAKYVVYVTNEFLQRRYPTKGRSIGCSNVLLFDADPNNLENRLNKISHMVGNEILKLGTAGAVDVSFKGQEYVIKAIAELQKKGKFFHYYLAGGGNKTRLEELSTSLGVKDYVHLLGSLPKDKMDDFYDSIDIYIHPSMAEGLPRVVIEAERRGLPACGANASGTPELLDPEFVFDKKNVTAICKVLEKFDKNTMYKQSQTNFERSKQYSFDLLTERRRKFYNDVICESKA